MELVGIELGSESFSSWLRFDTVIRPNWLSDRLVEVKTERRLIDRVASWARHAICLLLTTKQQRKVKTRHFNLRQFGFRFLSIFYRFNLKFLGFRLRNVFAQLFLFPLLLISGYPFLSRRLPTRPEGNVSKHNIELRITRIIAWNVSLRKHPYHWFSDDCTGKKKACQ